METYPIMPCYLGTLKIMERHAPYIGNISAQKLFHSNADSYVNVRIAMENMPEKISPIKGAALPKTYRLVTVACMTRLKEF
jgi:hypothetical protein